MCSMVYNIMLAVPASYSVIMSCPQRSRLRLWCVPPPQGTAELRGTQVHLAADLPTPHPSAHTCKVGACTAQELARQPGLSAALRRNICM